MSSNLAAALLGELGETELRNLAEMLRPYLEPAAPGGGTDGLLSARQAGARLGLHEGTVTRLAREERLVGAQKVGGVWRFDPVTLAPVRCRPPAPAPQNRRAHRVPVAASASGSVVDAIRGG